jgi:branched-chain amino acid transport system ATP-binding protein
MTNEPLIEARGLDVFYGASHVLHGVDFAVQRGESVALMGRNGMGKTTLLRTLVGQLRARRGELRVRGRDATGEPPHRIARSGIAYVPEGRGIFPSLSVEEHLRMAARAGADGRREWDFDRVLQTFPRLKERLHHGGAQLSGGEQQMLSIGRALVTNPALLILDEATEGLAPLIAREIWNVIRHVAESGVASIIVDKDLRTLARLVDRSVILVKGRVVFDGAPQVLIDQPELQRTHLAV